MPRQVEKQSWQRIHLAGNALLIVIAILLLVLTVLVFGRIVQ